MRKNKKINPKPTGGQSKGSITYMILGSSEIATIDPISGEVTIKNPSRGAIVVIVATKVGDANYHAISDNYILAVSEDFGEGQTDFKKEQTGFTFAQDSITLTYDPNAITSNIASGGQSTGAISYSIDKDNVATVDNNGQVTIRGAGTAIITARKAGDANYKSITSNYKLVVDKANQTRLKFVSDWIQTRYKENLTVTQVPVGGQGTGKITYSVRYYENIVTVNSSGVVTVHSPGVVAIKARKAGDANYNPSKTAYYVLGILYGHQTGFNFAQSSITMTYAADATASNIATGGESSGEISYSIDNTSVATIDEHSGELTIKGAGVATITAIKAQDPIYNSTENSYVLTVNKAEQTDFKFAEDIIIVAYAKDAKISNSIIGGQGSGAIIYSIDNTTVATIDENTGEVTLKSTGTAKITATKAGDANHNSATTNYVLTVNDKQDKTVFGFSQDVITVEYAVDKTIQNIATGGGTGAVSYSIDNTNVATINSTNGEVTLQGVGTATITANKAGDGTYSPASASYSLRVGKLSITLGIKNMQFVWTATTGTDHYRLESDIGGGFVDASTTGFVVVPNSTNIKQTNARADIALHRYVPLLKGEGPLYRVEACDAGNTCSDDARVGGSLSNEELNQLIGYFKASNTGADDRFGNAVSLSDDGNTLAVGAPREDSSSTGVDGEQGGGASNSGAVYVFTRSAGTWSQQAYIKASNTGASDYFGWSVSLSGDGNTLAVGAPYEDSDSTGVNGIEYNSSATDSGAVYVFTRNNDTWSQQAYIKASNTDGSAAPQDSFGDEFGWSVSLSDDGNTLAVGAYREDSNAKGVNGKQNNDDGSANRSGAVYVFTRSDGTWSQQAYIKASNTGATDQFGGSVSLSDDGDTLAVGAQWEDSNAKGINGEQGGGAGNSGAVYVFTRNSSDTWSQQAYIKASNTDVYDEFGWSVSLSGDGNTLAVGVRLEDSNSTGVNGAQGNVSRGFNSGAVYVFVRDSSAQWSQQAYIKASNTGEDDFFGDSVSLSGDGNTLAVGAQLEDSNSKGIGGDQDDNSATNSGAVYVFTRNSDTWSQEAYIKASNTDRGGYSFGDSVSLSGDGNSLAVGATVEHSDARGVGGDQHNNRALWSGAVYLY